MRTGKLVRRSLVHYWRSNLVVIAGSAIAVSVLAGAFMVGDSVRASLRDLLLRRLGNTHSVIAFTGFFSEELAAAFDNSCPLISLEGLVTSGDRRASEVAVYGVDERFWKFHGLAGEPVSGRTAMLSESVATEVGAKPGDSILVRVEKPSAIPAESLHGRKEDSGRTLRLTLREGDAEFSFRPGQSAVRAVFVPLARLQRDLDQTGRVNTILTSSDDTAQLAQVLKARATLEDLGIRARQLSDGLSLEAEGALITDRLSQTAVTVAKDLSLTAAPVFTYLANSLRSGNREIPYSLVTAIDLPEFQNAPANAIFLNEWAAQDLGAKPGANVRLEYYVWKEEGRLATESADFQVAGILPIRGIAADRDLTPSYPGMTDAETLHEWDPPFPVDLKRVRPRDEDYWKRYRTTPKAFIRLERGQQLWQSRFGKLTSIRLSPTSPQFALRLRDALDPLQNGFLIHAARAEGLKAAEGSTDFGEYFLYFSFFLVVSAMLLIGLFFKLNIEQRLREIGILRAVGFPPRRLRSLFLREGLALALAGGLIGVAGAIGYAAFIVFGLRTWWVGAVGTRLITLHVSRPALLDGFRIGIMMAAVAILITLRSLRRASPRSLLAGELPTRNRRTASRWIAVFSSLAACGAIVLTVMAARDVATQAGAFFGAGALLLAASLGWLWVWLSKGGRVGTVTVARLGFRNAAHRPGRSVLSIALIAFATFLIVAIDSFRREGGERPPRYPLLAESVLPLYQFTETPLAKMPFIRYRLRPGEDASCLNLFQPRNPRILGVPVDAADQQAPWPLLREAPRDNAIPALADVNSLTYSLHLKVGDIFTMERTGAAPVRLRIVATLQDSIFQRELLISEDNFKKLFPEEQGYRFFQIDAPLSAAAFLEESLSDYGFDVTSAAERLAGFHRVENTYLSTFQTLGALGLILGTAGLAAVLLRNILENRRELALLQAVGYRTRHLATMVLAENALLLAAGLGAGTLCAAVAVTPVVMQRGGGLVATSIVPLLAGVLATGLLASLAAILTLARSPLLDALRTE